MAKERVTKRLIERLLPDPSGKPILVWDTELPGFGLVISKSGIKSFVVQGRIGTVSRRVTVGRADLLSLDEARGRGKELLARMLLGDDPKRKPAPPPPELTLQQALDGYLKAKTGLRPKAVACYRASIEGYLPDWLHRPLREIDVEMVEERHLAIKAAVEKRRRRPNVTGAATANLTFVSLRAIWNHFSRRDPTLPPSPTDRLRGAWHDVPRRERYVGLDRLADFHAAVVALPSPIHRDLIAMLLYSGLRLQEAATLRWEEVDFATKTVRISAGRMKNRKRFVLPMSDLLFDVLMARQRYGRDESGYIFPSNSKSGHVEGVSSQLSMIGKNSDIVVSAHDLRRTFITVADSADISIAALKSLVTHSLGNDITFGYLQLSQERLREAAQKVADRMKVLCAIELPAGEKVARLP